MLSWRINTGIFLWLITFINVCFFHVVSNMICCQLYWQYIECTMTLPILALTLFQCVIFANDVYDCCWWVSCTCQAVGILVYWACSSKSTHGHIWHNCSTLLIFPLFVVLHENIGNWDRKSGMRIHLVYSSFTFRTLFNKRWISS